MPRHEFVCLNGTIEDVFGHRFVLRTEAGKFLADLTPKGIAQFGPVSGDAVAIEGERKPSEIKIQRIVRGDQVVDIESPAKPGHAPPHAHDPTAALESVRAEGYEVLGRPRAKPRHFEILARMDGALRELHVELDGRIRKAKPVQPGDHKWSETLG